MPVNARVAGSSLGGAAQGLGAGISMVPAAQAAQAGKLAPDSVHILIRQHPAPLCLLLRPAYDNSHVTVPTAEAKIDRLAQEQHCMINTRCLPQHGIGMACCHEPHPLSSIICLAQIAMQT